MEKEPTSEGYSRGATLIAPKVLITTARLTALGVPGVVGLAPIPGGGNRLFRRGGGGGRDDTGTPPGARARAPGTLRNRFRRPPHRAGDRPSPGGERYAQRRRGRVPPAGGDGPPVAGAGFRPPDRFLRPGVAGQRTGPGRSQHPAHGALGIRRLG